ncbi:nuclear transport factor 2 family protein [Aestuariivirga litoralis]|uniref:nuclear transport factor 2 family protein n=1 Tax=Aestuariivirga litoralis TaxID=2650924 RepID=UPI0018C4CF15|nr:nuclear transport factor 2 family protein [Aestuariivirga litoralis]
MNQNLITRVQEIYQAFGRGDIAAVTAQLSDDASFGMVGRAKDVPMAGLRKGKKGAAEFFGLLHETQELRSFSPLKFAANEDMVFVLGHTQWTMRRNGVEGENAWVHVFTFDKSGLCTGFQGHQDTGLLAEAYHSAPAAQRAAVA